jgi:glycosyltransferase involved in cell wall biosynthesis
MTRPPLVSIVTPSFNQARFLRRTVLSVLTQTYPHIEHIVMDGGSTDDSVAILRSFGDRLSWVSERDHGQAHALNKGFARTQGDVLAYLCSDDVLAPGAVEKVVAAFEEHADWDVLYGRAAYIDEADRRIGEYRTAPFTFRRLLEDNCICQPAAFWRRSLALQVGPFNERLHGCMDYEYWLRMARAGGRFGYLDDLLAAARLYPETKTMSCRLQMYRESIDACLTHAGTAPAGHFLGIWQQLCRERSGIWDRWLAASPRLLRIVAELHRCWRLWRGPWSHRQELADAALRHS